MVYINGIKATKKALKLLTEHLNAKRVKITLTTTRKGNLNINTFDL